MRKGRDTRSMNKQIRLVTLCMAMLAVLFFSTAAAFAGNGASTPITITPDKTEAEPGDTISFTITLGPVSEFGTMQMVLVIPEGLTYEAGSGALADGLKDTLGFDAADFTEVSRMVNGYASRADYSSDGDTVICTFRCTVNEGFNGSAEVGLTKLEFYSCKTWKNHTSEYTVQTATIKVGEEEVPPVDPTPSGQTDPAVDPTPSGETDPAVDPTPSGETDPTADPTPSGETDPAVDPTPSGETDPAVDPTPSGETDPTADPTPSGETDPAVDPTPSGETDPAVDPTPSGETDPAVDPTPSGEKTADNQPSDGQTPSGDTTPEGKGSSGDTTPDPGKNDGNNDKNGQNGSGSGDPSKNGSEGRTEPQKDTQSAFPWWAAVAAVVVIAALIIVFKRKDRKD